MTFAPVWRLSERDAAAGYKPADAAESARAGAFLDPQRAQDFLHARHTMRSLIAEATGRPPETVALLAPDDAAPGISGVDDMAVSWSRSGPVAIAGLLRAGRIGVDVERRLPRPVPAMLDMIAATGEKALVLDAGPDENEKLSRFYRLWTAKEALLKWQGSGLRGGARRVPVPRDHVLGAASETRLQLDETEIALWAPAVPGGHIAAIAFSR